MIQPDQVPPSIDGIDAECVRSDAGLLWFPRSDGVMRPYVAKRGTWEPEEGALIKALLRPGTRFLDVGANVGYFSLFVHLHDPYSTIDAVEPHPLTQRLLRMNLWHAGARSTVWPLALSRGDRVAALSTAATNLGDTRSRMDDMTGVVADLLAPAISADELFPQRQFDLVKIDVQGSESAVLLGMRDIIARSPDIKIICEFWPHAIREQGKDPVDVLEEYRANGLDVSARIAWKLRRLSPAEIVAACDSAGHNGQLNLLLTPRW